MRPLSILTITLLALCFAQTSEAQRVCYGNGVCVDYGAPVANTIRGAATVVRGTVSTTRSVVSSAPVIRRGFLGRRVYTHYSPSSSYSTSYGSMGSAGGHAVVSEPTTYVVSPYAESAAAEAAKPATVAKATATCECCNCEDKLKELEGRIDELERAIDTSIYSTNIDAILGAAPQQPAEKTSWSAIAAIAIATLPLLTRQV